MNRVCLLMTVSSSLFSATITGWPSGGISARADLRVSVDAPNFGDRWSDSVSDVVSRTYQFTIVDGERDGPGVMRFRGETFGTSFNRSAGQETLRSTAEITAPFRLQTRPFTPQGSTVTYCGLQPMRFDPCMIDFTFGMPFDMQFRATAESYYSYTRNGPGLDPTIGPMVLSYASISVADIYEPYDGQWTSIPGALVSITDSPVVHMPEPGTAALYALSGVALLLVRWRRPGHPRLSR